MTTSLQDIRFLVEREVKGTDIENQDIINWCNQANMEIGISMDIPSPTPQSIPLLKTTFTYALNVDVKTINRFRLQSDITALIDRDLNIGYRRYNQNIILEDGNFWIAPDTLVVDYFKHMTYFTTITQNIDIDDRFAPFYTYFCKIKHHNQQKDTGKVFWRVTISENATMINNYNNMKNQVIAYYSLGNEPIVVTGRWRG